jgi:hypothetical protein
MITLVPLLLVQNQSVAQVIDRLKATHNGLTNYAVQVSEATTAVVPTRIRITPTMCTLAMPNMQIVEVHPDKTRFYDTIFGMVATAKNDTRLKIPDGAANTAIVQRSPIGWILQSAERNRFFDDARNEKGWSVVGNSLVFAKKGAPTSSQILFDKKYRVTDIKLSAGGKVVSEWQFRYVGNGGVEFIPPKARVVPGLPQRPSLPQGTKGPLIFACQKVWGAMSRTHNMNIVQKLNGRTYTLRYGTGVTETSDKGKWSYAGGKLTLPNGKVFKSRDPLVDLHKNKIEVSPVGRYAINGMVPYLDLFNNAHSVEIEGGGKFNGQYLQIFKIVRGSAIARLYVDGGGRIAMMSSDLAGQMGSRLTIEYRPL